MNKEFDDPCSFPQLAAPVRVVYARPRTFISIAIGIVVFLLLPIRCGW